MLLADSELLARLIAFDTTSANSNVEMADFIAGYLDRPGVHIERVFDESNEKLNLLVHCGPPSDERSGLVLSGHMDVVPAREAGWRSDPFTMTEHGDRFVGRGTADMKGFLALAMNATARLDPAGLRAPLVLLLTYDEEVGCLGAKRFVDEFRDPARLPVSAIIGEPTSLEVVRMHKGHLKLRVVTRGIAAHSGYPHLGENAIEKAAGAVQSLAAIRRELEGERSEFSDFFPEVPFVSLNVGTIRGGAAINVVPDRCEFEVGIRLLPGMQSADIVQRVRRSVPEGEVEVISDSPPLLLDPGAQVHQAVSALVNQTGTRTVSFAADAGWLQNLGLECILFGPGSIEVAHRPNEFIPKDELHRGAVLIDQIIAQYCG
ncbi:MAG TPA: acetylornithine deacetylase [Thermoanaerobaculia bacterium]|nr:acetylornithine deacetylase [Thermoanaerobaculia bacterium]